MSIRGAHLWAVLLAALVVSQTLYALDPSFALSQYAKRNWHVEHGLPQNYVTSIAQGADGVLIVGTSGGVARFDGIQFSPVVLNERTGISREWINAVESLPDGAIWIATRDAGSFVTRNGRTQSMPPTPNTFTSTALRRDGSMVASGNGIWQAKNDAFARLSRDGGGDLSWEGILELPDGRLLFCDEKGLFAIEQERSRLLWPADKSTGRPLSLARGHNGMVYLGTTTGLFRVTVKQGTTLNRVSGVDGPVVSVVEDRDGLVWAATWGRGLFRVASNGASRWNLENGLTDDFVHTLFEDREGSLWIGTRAGLSRWRSGPIVPYGPEEGLDAQFLSTVTGNHQREIWVGSWRSGVHRIRNGLVEAIPLDFPVSTTLIRSMAFAPDGDLWFSDWTSLHHVSAHGPADYRVGDLRHGSPAHAILFDRHGDLWLGGMDGLFVYSNASLRGQSPRQLSDRQIHCLLEAKDGTIWVGTGKGLMAIREGKTREVAGLPHPAVTALHEDFEGRVWAATRANGLVRVDGERAIVFDHRHGLPQLPVYGILEDFSHNLWLSSPAGLFAVSLAELDEIAEGAKASADPIAFGNEDGLRSIEFQNVGFPSGWRDEAGHLWFPTVRGLVEVRPEALRAHSPPRILTSGIQSAGRTHEIAYSTNQLYGADRVEFRYRVEGLQTDWIALGTQRTLRLDTLPAGEHRIDIAAKLPGSAWGSPAVVRISQPSRWFETWWFYGAIAMLLAIVLWAIYRWRVSQVRMRYALVMEERNRLGREWHDTLLAGFSAISWQLDSARKSLPEDGSGAARDAIHIAKDMLRHYRTEARQVIWDLRHSSPEHEKLPRALERSLQDILRDNQVEHRVTVEGDAESIPAEMAHGLLRICQEATLNASRHAGATVISVHLSATPTRVEARVTDDGRGFDPNSIAERHFGLAIMRERAARLGGSVQVESAPGVGTTIRAEIPLSRVGKR